MRGVIDFTQARLLDADWWRRIFILLKGMEQEDDARTLEHLYQFHLALAGNSGLTEDSFKKAQENAKDTFQDLIAVRRPWDGKTKEERQAKEISDYRQQYIAAFGVDPSDPKYQAELTEKLAAWNADLEKQRQAEPDVFDLVRQRIAERDAKLAELVRQRRGTWQGR